MRKTKPIYNTFAHINLYILTETQIVTQESAVFAKLLEIISL